MNLHTRRCDVGGQHRVVTTDAFGNLAAATFTPQDISTLQSNVGILQQDVSILQQQMKQVRRHCDCYCNGRRVTAGRQEIRDLHQLG
jgi:hypothetical protein